jgi:hypothetical protein
MQPLLKIRDSQMRALCHDGEDRFIERAAHHLARFFPHLFESFNRELLIARVRRGVEQAAIYGIASERDLLRWLNVAAALGEDFAKNPKYQWARRILESPLLPSDKAERLSRTALDVIQDLARSEKNPVKRAEPPSAEDAAGPDEEASAA